LFLHGNDAPRLVHAFSTIKNVFIIIVVIIIIIIKANDPTKENSARECYQYPCRPLSWWWLDDHTHTGEKTQTRVICVQHAGLDLYGLVCFLFRNILF
jgi:hypothetical protein